MSRTVSEIEADLQAACRHEQALCIRIAEIDYKLRQVDHLKVEREGLLEQVGEHSRNTILPLYEELDQAKRVLESRHDH